MNISKEETKKRLTQLSIGIIQQETAGSNDNQMLISVLDPFIRQAWEYICFIAVFNRLDVPDNIIDFVELLYLPVQDWAILGEHCKALGLSSSVLDENGLTAEFRALAEKYANTYKPHLELEDSLFREIFELCKASDDARNYSAIRTFLNKNPIYSDIYSIEDMLWHESLILKVQMCYELVPSICVREHSKEKYIVKCPHCGWALNWQRDVAYCHEDGPCNKIYPQLATFEQDPQYHIAYHPNLARTKEGIQRFVVAPEVALVEIYEILQQEPFVHCELFPNFDSYDLLIILPDGKRWAIDVKDWQSAVSLAIGVSQKPFKYLPEWDKAFYVFPDYLAKRAYMNEFKNFWIPQKDVSFMNQKELIRYVREMTR